VKLTTKLLAVGAVAVLVVSGLAIALLASPNASATNDDAPVVAVDELSTSNGTHNLTVNVLCKVNGTRVALAGVNVTICTINITKEANRTTIEIVKVAEGQTDENGTVVFELAEGKYFVFAQHNGLKGFCRGNLTEDQLVTIKMHHWNWGHMKGQKFQFLGQANHCSCCQDRSCDGSGNMTSMGQGAKRSSHC
jgi:hypothetical protein